MMAGSQGWGHPAHPLPSQCHHNMPKDICKKHPAGRLHSPKMTLRDMSVAGTQEMGAHLGGVERDTAESCRLCCPSLMVTSTSMPLKATSVRERWALAEQELAPSASFLARPSGPSLLPLGKDMACFFLFPNSIEIRLSGFPQ